MPSSPNNSETHPPAAFELATAARIIFGAGRIRELPAIVAGRRTLLVTGRRGSPVPIDAVHHVRVDGEPTIEDAQRAAAHADVEIVVAIGGGSALDLGKAAAALIANGGDPLRYLEVIGEGRPLERPSLPCVAIPTTAGTGSEVTRNAVLGSPTHGVKASLRSPHMLPAVALVDPELTYDLPPALTASTGLDALTQLIEPFVSARANAFVDAICRDAIPRVIAALPKAFAGDRAARADMAYASLCGGLALANAGLGAVHGFAGPIGGRFPAPHGAICAVLLPHVVADQRGAHRRSEVRRAGGDDRRPRRVRGAVRAAAPLVVWHRRGRRAGAGRAGEAGQLDEGEPGGAVGRRSHRRPDPRAMSRP